MSVERIVDEIESLVVKAKRVPFTNMCMIEDDDMIRLLDDLRHEVPQEVQEANSVMQEKARIIEEAKREASKIVEQAKNYANKLVDESEIVRQSQAEANDILENAAKQSKIWREDSLKYADDVLKHLITNINSALTVVQDAHKELNKTSVK